MKFRDGTRGRVNVFRAQVPSNLYGGQRKGPVAGPGNDYSFRDGVNRYGAVTVMLEDDMKGGTAHRVRVCYLRARQVIRFRVEKVVLFRFSPIVLLFVLSNGRRMPSG